MIFLKWSGGLGNQMFQYAAARSLALSYNTDVCIFTPNFNILRSHIAVRKFELGHFELNQNTKFIEKKKLNFILMDVIIQVGFLIFKKIGKDFGFYNAHKEPYFYKDFFKYKDNTFIKGYFQSYKYFDKYSETIRNDFKFKSKALGKNRDTLKLIQSVDSVGLHVRRTDYIACGFNVCDIDYYKKCISVIAKTVKNPHFFIFSDDIEWVKENLKIDYTATYIDWNNSENAFEDMRLMSNCKHNIIANSTFSWWGAWLNNNPEKVVLAPKKWFPDSNNDMDDLIPEEWIKI